MRLWYTSLIQVSLFVQLPDRQIGTMVHSFRKGSLSGH